MNGPEVFAKQYYIHRSYANVYYYIYIALEDWISKSIFRNDHSRVFLSSNDYVFRRRYELTDQMDVSYDDLQASDLQFPFANYWPQNTGWIPDQRAAGVTAKMAYLGIYEGNTLLKAIPSILSIPVTFYFDREDDARIAYDTLYFKSFNEHYYEQDMPYGDNTLKIPINIEIKNLSFNPSFKESDWLKDNRIFIISANIDVRSFAIQPPLQPDYNSSITGTSMEYDDGISKYYITKEVILNPLNDPNIATTLLPPKNEEESEEDYKERINIYLKDSEAQKEYMTLLNKNYMDLATTIVDGTGRVQESNIEARIYSTDISINSIRVDWIIENPSEDQIDSIVIDVPSRNQTEKISVNKNYFILNDLHPNSDYVIYVTFHTKDGCIKRLGTIGHTKPEDEFEEPKNSLVGLSW